MEHRITKMWSDIKADYIYFLEERRPGEEWTTKPGYDVDGVQDVLHGDKEWAHRMSVYHNCPVEEV